MASPVYTVIDVINYKSEWLPSHAWMPQTDGVLLMLDPSQIRGPQHQITRVRVARMDGSSVVLDVSQVTVNPDGVICLFFAGMNAAEFSRGLTVEPVAWPVDFPGT